MDGDVIKQIVSSNNQLQHQNQLLKQENRKLKELLDIFADKSHNCPCGRALRYLYKRQQDQQAQYTCNKCKESILDQSEIWWRCQECDLDLCVNCEGLKKNICPFGHILNEDIASEELNCDACHQQIHVNSRFYGCKCQFDLCQDCKKE